MDEQSSVDPDVKPPPSTPCDAEVLERYARGGDMQAFNTIVERYEADLMRCARALLGDGEAAQDAVQETLLRLVNRARRVAGDARSANPEARIGPWLYTVLRRHCIDQLRRRGKRGELRLIDGHDTAVGGQAEVVVARRERAAQLWSAVAELPPLERAVVVLRYQEELDYQAIAERLGKTVNHVGVLLHRAVKRLRAAPVLAAEATA